MRELNECEAEVFRRSEKRIKQRRRTRNRVLSWCIPLCFVAILSGMMYTEYNKAGKAEKMYVEHALEEFGSIDSFSFSLTWGVFGSSSYDSKTGKLVKDTHVTNPEDYVTTYWLTEEQKQEIYDLIFHLNVTDYPDTYNPCPNAMTAPSMTLILSVKTDTIQKTVKAADISVLYESDNREGQEFLDVCKAIEDILTSTEEWKAFPEYEVLYD